MEKKESIFSSLNPAPAWHPPASSTAGPAPAHGRVEKDARIEGLEAMVKALQVEVAALKQAVSKPPPPPVKAEADMNARLERSEKVVAELKSVMSEFQSRVEKRIESPASKEEIETVKFKVSEVVSDFEMVRRKLADYAEDFVKIERDCHKSLGEMQGYARNIGQKLVSERYDEHMKETLLRLSGKVADLEKVLHAGLADFASRLMADETLYGKIFADAEDRLRKGLDPDIQAVSGQLKSLSSKVMWLTEEYTIVMERKMRALEVKYSAFDVIAARVDAINDTLRSEKKIEQDRRPARET